MTTESPVKLIAEYLNETKEFYSSISEEPDVPITSLPKLNEYLHGLPFGQMIIIGGKTRMGKSAFVSQLMIDAAVSGAPVLYLSFEMTPIKIIGRMFSQMKRVNNLDVFHGRFPAYSKSWEEFDKQARDLKVAIGNNFGRTWEEINDFINDLTVIPKVIIIDYIQAVPEKTHAVKKEIDEYIKNFRALCIEKNFCGIILCQINRQNNEQKDKRPQLHQLQGSSFLEQHADIALLLDWCSKTDPFIKDKSKFVCEVAKNKDGREGFIKMRFLPEVYTFIELSDEEEQQQSKNVFDDEEEK